MQTCQCPNLANRLHVVGAPGCCAERGDTREDQDCITHRQTCDECGAQHSPTGDSTFHLAHGRGDATTSAHTGPARVCGDCWSVIRPDEYEPSTYSDGTCSRCGSLAFVHRVSWAEVVSCLLRPIPFTATPSLLSPGPGWSRTGF